MALIYLLAQIFASELSFAQRIYEFESISYPVNDSSTGSCAFVTHNKTIHVLQQDLSMIMSSTLTINNTFTPWTNHPISNSPHLQASAQYNDASCFLTADPPPIMTLYLLPSIYPNLSAETDGQSMVLSLETKDFFNSTIIYNNYQNITGLPTAASCKFVHNSKIYFVGGFNSNPHYHELSTIYYYDMELQSWGMRYNPYTNICSKFT